MFAICIAECYVSLRNLIGGTPEPVVRPSTFLFYLFFFLVFLLKFCFVTM